MTAKETASMKQVRCTASGEVRTWKGASWAGMEPGRTVHEARCPDCGLVAPHEDLVWVRGTDLAPRAKTRSHKAPEGVTPAPYAALPNGGEVASWEVQVRDLHVDCALRVRNFDAPGIAMSDCCQKPAASAVEYPDGRRLWRCQEHTGLLDVRTGERGPIHRWVIRKVDQ